MDFSAPFMLLLSELNCNDMEIYFNTKVVPPLLVTS